MAVGRGLPLFVPLLRRVLGGGWMLQGYMVTWLKRFFEITYIVESEDVQKWGMRGKEGGESGIGRDGDSYGVLRQAYIAGTLYG